MITQENFQLCQKEQAYWSQKSCTSNQHRGVTYYSTKGTSYKWFQVQATQEAATIDRSTYCCKTQIFFIILSDKTVLGIANVLTDEKKFRYDGSDGWMYYWWHVSDNPGTVHMSKDYGTFKGIMLHMAISTAGILSLTRVRGKMNSCDRVEVVSNEVIPSAHIAHGDAFLYQKDNASIHNQKDMISYLEENGVKFLCWPALSHDLNSVENCWALRVRCIYAEGRSYDDDESLWLAIKAETAKLTVAEIIPFVNSFRSRLTEILLQYGKYIQ
ncbi:MAG: putative Transposable element Tc3 transposase [Streblomastix strix]|uniref:Putative Transposable element Tc3 transposase n=1 Tax=Streblomastix strix TaxID=222440 RepID=A0A5J4X2E9_9EUKA|nr:MAG: putative Transposable element Tc3 transposase [Streblomastix strix]